MFRKSTILLLLLLLLPCSPALAHERSNLLSEEELRALYGDATDELSPAEASELLLSLVNHEREAAGLSRLALLHTAEFMARRHAGDMARQGYGSHYDLDGRNPVERYNRLGGTDYVQENLIVLEIEWPLFLSERLVRSFHAEWMESPDHRAAVLLPQATHMGAAFELSREGRLNRMAGVCEFVCERGDYSRLPQSLAAGDSLTLSGQLQPGTRFAWISIGLQPSAKPRSLAELNTAQDSYSLPAESLLLEPVQAEGPARSDSGYMLELDSAEASFRLEMRSPAAWAGQTAYVYIYAIPPDATEPECIACQTVELKG